MDSIAESFAKISQAKILMAQRLAERGIQRSPSAPLLELTEILGELTVVDQNYDPTSANAQSGTAVAEAVGYEKTTLDTPLQVNTSYDLGIQSSLTLTLPSTADALDEIYVAFESGSTPTTLAIIGDYAGDDDYEPSANCICELSFKYVCGIWSLVAKNGVFASINTVLGEIENGYY